MQSVKIIDGSFVGHHGYGFSGANAGDEPQHITWDRNITEDDRVIVFTDSHLAKVVLSNADKNIAILIESPGIRPGIYDWIRERPNIFDVVLTHNKSLVSMGPPFLFAPFGGSRIPLSWWATYDKNAGVCSVASRKTKLEGHRLRHEVAKMLMVSTYGENYVPLIEKLDLKGYRYQVVIENCRHDWYFTEKLIDAFAVGSIPIYWGCDISKFFDMNGVITFDTIEGLEKIIANLTPEFYEERRKAVKNNIKEARKYRCPEDWIWRTYPRMFT